MSDTTSITGSPVGAAPIAAASVTGSPVGAAPIGFVMLAAAGPACEGDDCLPATALQGPDVP